VEWAGKWGSIDCFLGITDWLNSVSSTQPAPSLDHRLPPREAPETYHLSFHQSTSTTYTSPSSQRNWLLAGPRHGLNLCSGGIGPLVICYQPRGECVHSTALTLLPWEGPHFPFPQTLFAFPCLPDLKATTVTVIIHHAKNDKVGESGLHGLISPKSHHGLFDDNDASRYGSVPMAGS
jgi:hypothetical protein